MLKSIRIFYLVLIAFFLVDTAPSFAYSLWTAKCPSGRKWDSDPKMHFSSTSFPDPWHRQAIYDIEDRIDQVGGHNWNVSSWGMRDSISRDNSYNELWRGSLDNADGLAARRGRNCKITRTDIIFSSDVDWAHGWPAYYGSDFWTEGTDVGDQGYIRSIALHEMLHMAGLNHVDNQFAMMSYGSWAWTNLAPQKQMEPLPDDRQGLRVLYPSPGGEEDLAIFNTYNDPEQIWEERKVTYQEMLCATTAGTGFAEDPFGNDCAENPTLEVCPGDIVYSRFTVANHGLQTISISEAMWFSENQVLDAGDVISSNVYIRDITEDYSTGRIFQVPALAPGTYHMIVRVVSGVLFEEDYQNNWIPMRKQVTVKNGC